MKQDIGSKRSMELKQIRKKGKGDSTVYWGEIEGWSRKKLEWRGYKQDMGRNIRIELKENKRKLEADKTGYWEE